MRNGDGGAPEKAPNDAPYLGKAKDQMEKSGLIRANMKSGKTVHLFIITLIISAALFAHAKYCRCAAEVETITDFGKKKIILYLPAKEPVGFIQQEVFIKDSGDILENVKQTVMLLIRNTGQQHMTILPEDTKLLTIFIDSDGTLYLDFSEELRANLPPSAFSELLLICSLGKTIFTNYPMIERIKFLIEGEETEKLTGHLLFSGPFKRGDIPLCEEIW